MGGLKERMPVTYWTFLIFTLAISGVPLTSGFLSKDEILAGTLAFSGLTGHAIVPVVGFLVAGITAFYMFRMVILTFHGSHAKPGRLAHIHESPKVMVVPLVVLAALSFFFVYSLNPISGASGWIAQSLERPVTSVPAALAAAGPAVFEEALHHAHFPAMGLSLLVAGLGILIAFMTYRWKRIDADAVAARFGPLHRFLMNKWYFDELYNGVVVGGTLLITRVLRWFDNNIIDGLVNASGWLTKIVSIVSGKFDTYVVDGAVNASGYLSGFAGLVLRKTQTGRIQTYAVLALLGVMIFYFVFRIV
jgi:NADH-quinone oxidoreductase subunit L